MQTEAQAEATAAAPADEPKKVVVHGWSETTPTGSKVFVAPHPSKDGVAVVFTSEGGARLELALSDGAARALERLLGVWRARAAMERLLADTADQIRGRILPSPMMYAGCPPLPPVEVEEFWFHVRAGTVVNRWRVAEDSQQPEAPAQREKGESQ